MNNLSVNDSLFKANLFVKKGKTDEAVKIYRDILKKFSKNRRALEGLQNLNYTFEKNPVRPEEINKLLDLYNTGKMIELDHYSNDIITNFASNYLVLNLKGIANIALKNYQKAEISFLEAIKLSPFESEIHNNLGIALKEQKKYDQSFESYKKAISLKSNFYETYNNIGVLLQEMKKYEESIPYFKKTISLKTNYSNAYNNMGMSFKGIGKIEQAIESFRNALLYDKNHSQAYCNLGIVLLIVKNFDEAITSLLRAISINPNYEAAYNNIGIAYKEVGNFEAAISNFQKAISLKPNYYQVYNNLGAIYHNNGNYNQAIENYKKAILINPNYHQAKHMLDALLGKNKTNTHNDYIIDLFDEFAGSFENSLKNKLSYTLPSLIKDLVLTNNKSKNLGSILDLGCGTGLVGKEFVNYTNDLQGVDISKLMINEAQKKQVYNNLTEGEIVDYLSTNTLDFNYFIAADVFIYIGDISKIFSLIKSKNKSSGKLVFSTEHNDNQDIKLEVSGRFSHSKNYIDRLCYLHNFKILSFEIIKLRKDRKDFITGGLYMLSF